MEKRQKHALFMAAFLPSCAVGAYMLASPAPATACSPLECAYGSGCFSSNACNQNHCTSGHYQRCAIVAGVPTWGDCGICSN
jgi:hypothetical protein